MSNRERRKNPFRADMATRPGRLAGRKDVQDYIKEAIEPIISNEGEKYTPTVLYGPRGMGKTVLLRWAAETATAMALEEGVRLEVLYSAGQQDLPDISGIRKLKPFGRKDGIGKGAFETITSMRPRKPLGFVASLFAKVNVGIFQGGGNLESAWGEKAGGKGLGGNEDNDNQEHAPIFHPSHRRYAEALFARCRKRAVLLLVDEGHTYSPELKKGIIAIAATAITRDLPFHLILAGTPGIISMDGMKNLTYWERVEEKSLGCLDRKSTKDAIMLPLNEDGIAISEDALDIIFKESHGYPYFVQRWGQVLWDHAERQGITAITKKEIVEVRGVVNEYRDGFYWDRYAAIRDQEYLVAHYAVAGAMERKRYLSHDILVDAIEEVLPIAGGGDRNNAAYFAKELEADDFLWAPGGVYQPGIPSFMNYFKRQFSASRAGMAAAIEAIQERWTPEPTFMQEPGHTKMDGNVDPLAEHSTNPATLDRSDFDADGRPENVSPGNPRRRPARPRSSTTRYERSDKDREDKGR